MFEGMSKELWTSVDRYLEGALLRPDPALDAALHANAAAGLPAIDVALAEVVDVPVGPALDTLATLVGQHFDLVFIDADKPNNAAYLAWALRLTRPGSAIVVDNVVREGAILDAASTDPRVQGTRRMFESIAQEPRLEATAIQTVGSKGHDGFVLARVVAPQGAAV
jgi:predicted O-methyltransferase YrrM